MTRLRLLRETEQHSTTQHNSQQPFSNCFRWDLNPQHSAFLASTLPSMYTQHITWYGGIRIAMGYGISGFHNLTFVTLWQNAGTTSAWKLNLSPREVVLTRVGQVGRVRSAAMCAQDTL